MSKERGTITTIPLTGEETETYRGSLACLSRRKKGPLPTVCESHFKILFEQRTVAVQSFF